MQNTIPSRDDKEESILKEVERELAELQRKVEQSPTQMKALGRTPLTSGSMPMNDTDLSETIAYNNERTAESNADLNVQEIFTRLAELEDNMPEFKSHNSWDTPLAFLPATATLEQAVSAINKLIQRSTRQDRLK